MRGARNRAQLPGRGGRVEMRNAGGAGLNQQFFILFSLKKLFKAFPLLNFPTILTPVRKESYSTVTLFAKFRGLSGSRPRCRDA